MSSFTDQQNDNTSPAAWKRDMAALAAERAALAALAAANLPALSPTPSDIAALKGAEVAAALAAKTALAAAEVAKTAAIATHGNQYYGDSRLQDAVWGEYRRRDHMAKAATSARRLAQAEAALAQAGPDAGPSMDGKYSQVCRCPITGRAVIVRADGKARYTVAVFNAGGGFVCASADATTGRKSAASNFRSAQVFKIAPLVAVPRIK